MQLRRLNLVTGGRGEALLERGSISRIIDLELKDLRGEVLNEEEAAALAEAELVGWTAPETFVSAVLDSVLPLAPLQEEDQGEYRVAAASDSGSVYDAVVECINEGEQTLGLQVNGDTVTVLRIEAAAECVVPLYVEGYTYIVQRPGGEEEKVGRLGMYLAFADLRAMSFTYDPSTKTIRLSTGR